jgi:hypothetical protein
MNATATSSSTVYTERQARELNHGERRVRQWVRRNHGLLSQIAREFSLSVQFVNRIAYNQNARSADLRVERRLKSAGCPLMQKV